jgi:hypothetical protein
MYTRCVLVILAAGIGACGGPAQSLPPFTPVATVDQVMDSIVIPSSQAIFDAVVYENGELVTSPGTDDEWYALQMHAFAVAEAGNLLLIPPRAKEAEDWAVFSKRLTDAAVDVTKAAEAKDVERMLKTGGDLYRACVNCHAKYLPEE